MQFSSLKEKFNFLFDYEPITGKLYHKNPPNHNTRLKGKEVGSTTKYKATCINKVTWYIHEIIWIMHYGNKGSNEIDHINHDKLDNRVENLRLVTRSENNKNRGLSPKNTSGITGVCWSKVKKKWESKIKINGKDINLGRSSNFFEACCLRKSAECKYNFHPNHGKQL
jgi:hypothetical protein